MSQACSVSARKKYGLARVCRVWAIPRSTVYHHRVQGVEAARSPGKRGPLGACSDEELVEKIKEVQRGSPWVNEGHRKVWARLRTLKHIRTARRRVLRVMRENDLLAVVGPQHPRGPKNHDRTIIPDAPDRMWGTDGTSTLTGEGQATVFFVIDHHTAECLSVHAARRGTRWEAVQTLRRAVWLRFGRYEPSVAGSGKLALRHDHGSQFTSCAFQDELRFLAIASSPSYVREPEGNGCSERFVRTLKEQLLWLRRFETVEELTSALQEFRERYNREWRIERHGWRSPSAYRESLQESAEQAA